jgi:HAD superfamily, subfamily IIIB (Acid phosphatase)
VAGLERTGARQANAGVLALYRQATAAGVAVFFITGRHEALRAATERQLRIIP